MPVRAYEWTSTDHNPSVGYISAVYFGGFVNLHTSLWFGGGIASSAFNALFARKRAADSDVPEDMSSTSLVGGGLIAGDALAALGIGIAGLLSTLAAR